MGGIPTIKNGWFMALLYPYYSNNKAHMTGNGWHPNYLWRWLGDGLWLLYPYQSIIYSYKANLCNLCSMYMCTIDTYRNILTYKICLYLIVHVSSCSSVYIKYKCHILQLYDMEPEKHNCFDGNSMTNYFWEMQFQLNILTKLPWPYTSSISPFPNGQRWLWTTWSYKYIYNTGCWLRHLKHFWPSEVVARKFLSLLTDASSHLTSRMSVTGRMQTFSMSVSRCRVSLTSLTKRNWMYCTKPFNQYLQPAVWVNDRKTSDHWQQLHYHIFIWHTHSAKLRPQLQRSSHLGTKCKQLQTLRQTVSVPNMTDLRRVISQPRVGTVPSSKRLIAINSMCEGCQSMWPSKRLIAINFICDGCKWPPALLFAPT